MPKTQDKIKELLRNVAEMNQSQIQDGLETLYGINLTSDSVWQNLRKMETKGDLTVVRKKDSNYPEWAYTEGRIPWVNYYSLKKKTDET